MARHTFEIDERLAKIVHNTMRDRRATVHNWIASAVERGDLPYAQSLTKDLRDLETIAATFNLDAKLEHSPDKRHHTQHVLV